MEDDDDFTFPTTVAVAMAPAVRRVPGPAAPAPVGATSSRLWPFAAPLTGAAAATKEAPAASTTRREQEERAAAVDDEDRMDLLWDDTAAAAAAKTTASRAASAKSTSGVLPKPAEQHPAKEDDERAAAVAEQERMDLLWESFNEELLLLRHRARAKSKAPCGGDGRQQRHRPEEPDWYLCPSSVSDADESEEASSTAVSSPGRARYGCAPTMLRASSRAGGAGQFYGGSPRRRSRRGGGWALLLRLFRRLFSAGADKAPPERLRAVTR